ncbi:unnamed protein product, partial [Mesorhabditis spiculigera]
MSTSDDSSGDEELTETRCDSVYYAALKNSGPSVVRRVPMNQERFEKEFCLEADDIKPSIWRAARDHAKGFLIGCVSGPAIWARFCRLLPILSWLPTYSIRENLFGDVMGGLTVGILQVPQGIAYAYLAGVGAINGLYASCLPAFIYIFFGTSRHASLGSFAVLALMSATANQAVRDHLGNELILETEISATLTFAVGLWLLLFWMLQLQCVFAYVSDAVMSAFTTGSAVHVLVSQLPYMLGVEAPRSSGPGYLFVVLWHLGSSYKAISLDTLICSWFAVVNLWGYKDLITTELQRYFRCNVPIPYEFMMMVGYLVGEHFGGINAQFKWKVVGPIPTGLPSPTWPTWHILPICLLHAIPLVVVALSVHVSMSKVVARKFKYRLDGQQEFLALGVMSLISGLFPVFPVTTSLSRTMVNVTSGSKTQLSALFSCLLLLTLILWLGPLIEPLPMWILATVITVALQGMFVKCGETLRNLYQYSKIDAFVWVVCFVATVAIDVMPGLVISVVISLVTVIFRIQWLSWEKLTFPGTSPAIRILRFDGPILFLNAERCKQQATIAVAEWEAALNEPTSPDRKSFFRFLLLDLSRVTAVDHMGLDILTEVLDELRGRDIIYYICGAKTSTRKLLLKRGAMGKLSDFYPSIDDALAVITHSNKRLSQGSEEQSTDSSSASPEAPPPIRQK